MGTSLQQNAEAPSSPYIQQSTIIFVSLEIRPGVKNAEAGGWDGEEVGGVKGCAKAAS